MNKTAIHMQAKKLASEYKLMEQEILSVLEIVDREKIYFDYGYKSLFEYCRVELELSESISYAFNSVLRKSYEVPKLKQEILAGNLSIHKARRVVSVINKENQEDLINKAKVLPSRKLEQEVVKINPQKAIERTKQLTEELMQLVVVLNPEQQEKWLRVLDLVSTSMGTNAKNSDVLEKLMDLYIEEKDPLKKAERKKEKSVHVPKNRSTSQNIPATVKHEVMRRDKAKCTHPGCKETRYLHFHHIKPRSEGGTNHPNNLTLLCSAHHRMVHWQHESIST